MSKVNNDSYNLRYSSELANSEIDVEYSVLDHGFVKFVDYSGGDDNIAKAARCSYGGTEKTVQENFALIRFLMRHEHTSPFEQSSLRFLFRLPMFVADFFCSVPFAKFMVFPSCDDPVFYLPGPDLDEYQKNSLVCDDASRSNLLEISRCSLRLYKNMINSGFSRQKASFLLSKNFYVDIFWKLDIHNIQKMFLKFGKEDESIPEFGKYLKIISEKILTKVVPSCWSAFNDYAISSRSLEIKEMDFIRKKLSGFSAEHIANVACECGMSRREIVEFLEKVGVSV